MKKRILSLILALMLLLSTVTLVMSCKDTEIDPSDTSDTGNTSETEPETEPDPLRDEIAAFFNDEVFTAFNAEDFDKYVEYLDMDEETKTEIRGNLAFSVQYFSSKYTIETFGYDDNGDDTYNVTLQTLIETVNRETEEITKLREIALYIIKRSGDSFLIKNIIEGESIQLFD